MGNNKGKVGLDNDNTSFTVSAIDGSVVGSKKEVLLTRNVETVGLEARRVRETLDNLLDLSTSKL